MSDENRQGNGNFRANNGGQKRPAGGNRMSGNRTGGKNFGGKKPFSGEKRSFGGSKPAFGGEKRSFGGDKPAYNGEKRSFGGNNPAYNGEKRSFGGDKLAYNGEKRTFGGDKPAYNGEKRAFRGDKHNDGDKRPAKSGFGGEKRPYGDKKPPFGGKPGFRSGEKRPYGGGNGERRPYPAKPAAPKVEGSDGLPARRLALEVIRTVTENDAYASLVLDEKLNKCTLPLVDRRLAARLVYDTLEHLLTLDYALNSLMAKPDTDIKLRNVLRLGACQILLEDRIPESAACNTSVALCKELGMEGLAGVCNGILRNLVRQKDEIKYPDMETEPVKALSIRYSVPEWLVERLLADWGEDAEKLMGFHQPNAAITIRPNLMKMDEAAFEQFLGSKVWEKEKGMLPFSWRIRNMAEIAHDAGFVGGKFSIQSESSMMVCLAAAPKNGMQILDACAAPGGKSCLMAEMMQGTGRVQAWELHPHRADLIAAQVQRLGLENVRPMTRDALKHREELDGTMDIVLLDAPCSGLGVMSEKPDVKYRVTAQSVDELVQLQSNLLDAVCPYVKKGGTLVYSTCSVLKDENVRQAEKFLARHPDRLAAPAAARRHRGLLYVPDAEEKGMTELTGMTPQELSDWCKAQGMPAFRGKQIFRWIHQGADFDAMTNLPAAMRAQLKEIAVAQPVSIIDERKSQIDDTVKFLFGLKDGNCVEGVLMHYHHGYTLCISTQVGCRMGCKFCASTLEGCVRSLTAGEMLGEVLAANRYLDGKDRVHNIVLMGSGEPLDNYDNVCRFLRLLREEDGVNIGLRNVSLSTCGLVPKMYQFAEENLPVTLSVSLHAPNDEIRRQTMPVANAYPMDELLAACRNYIDKTGRRVIFEYALVGGVNCEEKHAIELASRLRGMQCHVNLIPLNAVEERHLKGVNEQTVQRFLHKLEELHISATRRREMGDDIEGACGQLRRKTLTTLHDPQGEEA